MNPVLPSSSAMVSISAIQGMSELVLATGMSWLIQSIPAAYPFALHLQAAFSCFILAGILGTPRYGLKQLVSAHWMARMIATVMPLCLLATCVSVLPLPGHRTAIDTLVQTQEALLFSIALACSVAAGVTGKESIAKSAQLPFVAYIVSATLRELVASGAHGAGVPIAAALLLFVARDHVLRAACPPAVAEPGRRILLVFAMYFMLAGLTGVAA